MNHFYELCQRFVREFRLPCYMYDPTRVQTECLQVEMSSIRRVETSDTYNYEIKGVISVILGTEVGWESLELLLQYFDVNRVATCTFSDNESGFFTMGIEFTEILRYPLRKTLFVKDVIERVRIEHK